MLRIKSLSLADSKRPSRLTTQQQRPRAATADTFSSKPFPWERLPVDLQVAVLVRFDDATARAVSQINRRTRALITGLPEMPWQQKQITDLTQQLSGALFAHAVKRYRAALRSRPEALLLPKNPTQDMLDALSAAVSGSTQRPCVFFSSMAAWNAVKVPACIDVHPAVHWAVRELQLGNTTAFASAQKIFFAHCENAAELRMQDEDLRSMPPLGSLTHLTHVQLGDNNIIAIEPGDLPASIESLDVHNNALTELALENYPSLRELDVSSNRIRTFTLRDLPALTTLNLCTNQLMSAEVSNLPALRTLALRRNRLQRFTGENLPELHRLDVSFNLLRGLDLRPLPTLVSVDTAHNRIRNIELDGLVNLRSLSLMSNRVAALQTRGLSDALRVYM